MLLKEGKQAHFIRHILVTVTAFFGTRALLPVFLGFAVQTYRGVSEWGFPGCSRPLSIASVIRSRAEVGVRLLEHEEVNYDRTMGSLSLCLEKVSDMYLYMFALKKVWFLFYLFSVSYTCSHDDLVTLKIPSTNHICLQISVSLRTLSMTDECHGIRYVHASDMILDT